MGDELAKVFMVWVSIALIAGSLGGVLLWEGCGWVYRNIDVSITVEEPNAED